MEETRDRYFVNSWRRIFGGAPWILQAIYHASQRKARRDVNMSHRRPKKPLRHRRSDRASTHAPYKQFLRGSCYVCLRSDVFKETTRTTQRTDDFPSNAHVVESQSDDIPETKPRSVLSYMHIAWVCQTCQFICAAHVKRWRDC